MEFLGSHRTGGTWRRGWSLVVAALRIVVAMYMQPEAEGRIAAPTPRLSAGVMALVCAAMVLALGVLPGWFLEHLH